MGARVVKFTFCPKENQQIEAVIKVPEEKRSVIHGTVVNSCGEAVKDAVVKLLEVVEHKESKTVYPITHTFTDENGQFIFGPLCANKRYMVKVWYNDVDVKPLVICPECEDEYCLRYEEDTCEGCTCNCNYNNTNRAVYE
ncbi:hypothetical protein SAMN02745163_04204 [Clostridium cavendishii DSM 21758]|uniref:Uncharacterized protein n=1 Tax=Clostridium cavendishii DSM 21758 TaxID=1121302 RepID=A0A1M6U7G7_9CLOT|nr:carboxypeptidase-like regulatory domain-containing protein [Clostridium cavendishii]SHK65225.1 hypothetical protein SAMN02745163_04204 [Clostridium cavendishii DSM 21758]